MLKNTMIKHFKKSMKEFNNFVKINRRRPTAEEWNEMAKDKNLLSNVSMRYMGNIRFKKRI